MPNPKNATEMIQQLHQQLTEEMREVATLQEQLRTDETKDTHLKQEIPQLQKQVEIDKHELFAVEADMPKIRAKIVQLQREKAKLQKELADAQHSLQDNIRKTNMKTHSLH